MRNLGSNAKRDVAPPETGRVLPGGRSKEKENAMELIAAAVAAYAIFIPVFLALEVATPHPGRARYPVLVPTAAEAAAAWLADHPLKPAPAADAANDPVERLAA